jgi:hypothetical protein
VGSGASDQRRLRKESLCRYINQPEPYSTTQLLLQLSTSTPSQPLNIRHEFKLSGSSHRCSFCCSSRYGWASCVWPVSNRCVPRILVSPCLPLFQPARSSGCNALVGVCYAGAGFVFGATIVAAPPAILACNGGLGTCMAACAVTALLAPTP